MGEDSKKNILTFEELRTIQKRGRTNDSLQPLDLDFFERIKDYLKIKKKMSDRLSVKEYENAMRVISDIFELRERKIIRLAELSSRTKIPLKNLLPEEKNLLENLREQFIKYHKIINSKINFEIEVLEENSKEKQVKKDENKIYFKKEKIEENKDIKIKEVEGTEDFESNKEEINEDEKSMINGELKNSEFISETVKLNRDISKMEKLQEMPASNKIINKEEIEEEKIKNKTESEKNSKKLKVRIKNSVPKFLGVDLKIYGPFKEGDLAELPEKNAQVLINLGLAENINAVFQQT